MRRGWWKNLYVQVLVGDRRRRAARPLRAGARREDEAARRRLHQAGEDDHRPGHLPDRGGRHREDGRPASTSAASASRRWSTSRSLTTLALVIGLVVGERGAAGRRHAHRSGAARRQRRSREYSRRGRGSSDVVDFLLDIIPNDLRSARSPRATCCRCCWSRCCSASALTRMRRARRAGAARARRRSSHVFFGIVDMIMRLAPIGAFGAMAFTIGKYGLGTLRLARLAAGVGVR